VGVEADEKSASESSTGEQIARKEGLEVQEVLGLSVLSLKAGQRRAGVHQREGQQARGPGERALRPTRSRPQDPWLAKRIARKEGLEVQKKLGLSALGLKQVNAGLGRPWPSAARKVARAGVRDPED